MTLQIGTKISSTSIHNTPELEQRFPELRLPQSERLLEALHHSFQVQAETNPARKNQEDLKLPPEQAFLQVPIQLKTRDDFNLIAHGNNSVFLFERLGEKSLLKEYDASRGTLLKTHEFAEKINISYFRISPDRTLLADPSGNIYDLTKSPLRLERTLVTSTIANHRQREGFLADSTYIQPAPGKEGEYFIQDWQIVDPRSGKVLREVSLPSQPLNFSEDGRYASMLIPNMNKSKDFVIRDTHTNKSFTVLKDVNDISTTYSSKFGVFLWDWRPSNQKEVSEVIRVLRVSGLAEGTPRADELFLKLEEGKVNPILAGPTQIGNSIRSNSYSSVYIPLGKNLGFMDWDNSLVIDPISNSTAALPKAPGEETSNMPLALGSTGKFAEHRFGAPESTSTVKTILHYFRDNTKMKLSEQDLMISIQEPKSLADFLSTVDAIERRGMLEKLRTELASASKRNESFENSAKLKEMFKDLGHDDFDKRASAQEFLSKMFHHVGDGFLKKEVLPLLEEAIQSKDLDIKRLAGEIKQVAEERLRYRSEYGRREARLSQAVELIEFYQAGPRK